MRVLGLDPGTVRIGYAIVSNDPFLDILATGKLAATNNQIKASKLIFHLIERYRPDAVAYEETGSFLKGTYANILKQATEIYKIPALAFKVTTIRELLYLDAHMSKQETHFILKNRFPIIRPELSRDEMDSISVCLATLNMQIVKG